MKLILTIDPLETQGFGRKEVIATLRAALGTSSQVAALRLDRALSSSTESFRRDVLAELFRMAEDRGVDWRDLFRLEPSSLFDLLPDKTTFTYLGAYGPVEGEELRYSDTITGSVSDYRSARRFGRCITRDYSHLRFAPSVAADGDRIVEKLRAATAQNKDKSILSIGSSKINTMSEWLIANALGLTPFSKRAKAQPLPPVEFVYAVSNSQREMLCERNADRCNGRFDHADEIGHSYLIWDGNEYHYSPPSESTRGGTSMPPAVGLRAELGVDYAVVFVEALASARGNVVVSGLTGAGTFGASALLCHRPALFDLPPGRPNVRLFLVEVELKRRVHLREPQRARVVAWWTKSTGDYEKPEHDEFSGLGIVSARFDPGDAPPDRDDGLGATNAV